MKCRFFPHNWLYNFSTMPNKRICTRCKLRQQLDLKAMEWHDNFEVHDKRTDQELINKWVDLKQ